jgi:subtilisin family serine protease
MPSATPQELAAAIFECVDAGARVINLSLALAQPSTKGEQALEEALDLALRRGVLIAAAAGNQGTLGTSSITRHPWVIPVVACDPQGRPINESNLGNSIGMRGLSAPGDSITSLGAEGPPLTLGGTSVAVPFVTGAIALLWSEFPGATASQIKLALTRQPQNPLQGGSFAATRMEIKSLATQMPRRLSVVPSLLNAEAAYQILAAANTRRSGACQEKVLRPPPADTRARIRIRILPANRKAHHIGCVCRDLSPKRRSRLATWLNGQFPILG